MKIYKLFLTALILSWVLLMFAPGAVVHAQEVKSPTVVLNISLQQGKIRINEPIPAIISVVNQSDVNIDAANLSIFVPESLVLYDQTCNTLLQPADYGFGEIKANSVKTQNVCFKLNLDKAYAGTYNLFFTLIYTWGEKTNLVTVEKPVEIDLIGGETILGIPLAFAGFVLPGLMLLMTLKWFKVPWAVNLATEDRIIYGVFISLLLLGPFSYFANRPDAGAWLQPFNLNEQVNFQRLAIFIAIGLVLGVAIGSNHARQTQKKAQLLINFRDSYNLVIKKSLLSNQKYSGGSVVFQNKANNFRIIGAHYVTTDTLNQVLPQFRLTVSQIADDEIKDKVREYLAQEGGDVGRICADSQKILRVIELISADTGKAFEISQPVARINPETMATEFFENLPFYEIKKEEYNASLVGNEETALLEIVD
ncbi:MAG: hypothetical protein FD147_1214 [Chloroflexi bacterium]|nr:MAG: hypothetical protein FD147_1214 [Chloroflexota bacterium]MBA4376953.1 hypothetical protein [Anaerolinea sp.]